MKVVATFSIKGGVGKTTAAVNLSYAAAQRGHRTLVWDLDPQGAASFCFRIKPKVKGGAKAIVRGRRELDPAIRGTDTEGLDLVPADFSYRKMDLLLEDTDKPKRRLRQLLQPLRDEYELVILDCPPNITLANEAMIGAADVLLVPLVPSVLSVRTLDRLEAFLAKRRSPVTVLPFISMLDRRRRLHLETEASLRSTRSDLLAQSIPYSSTVERMSVERAPLGQFAGRTKAAHAFAALWDEVERRLDLSALAA
jgi:chromosome partitioning protein